MEELELLRDVYSQRMDLIRADEVAEKAPSRALTLREKMQDPHVLRTIEKVRVALSDIPDIRRNLVEKAKRELGAGTFPLDGKTIANRILQQTILNEFS